MIAPATHLTGPDARPENRERFHAVLEGGYHVTVASPRELTGEQYCSVLRWLQAIRQGFESRTQPDGAATGEIGV